MEPKPPHRGITMHRVPVGGNFAGLVFTLGSMAIFLIAIPALWVPVLAAGLLGIGIAAFRQFIQRPRAPQRIDLR